MKRYILLLILGTLAACGRPQDSETKDIFLKFKDGNSASLYKQGEQVVFKLCTVATQIYTRECPEHSEKVQYVMNYSEYLRRVLSFLSIDPPYNSVEGLEIISRDISDIEAQMEVLELEEREIAKENLSHLKRLQDRLKTIKIMLANLEKGEVTPGLTGVNRSGKALILNETFRTRLFNIAVAPFVEKYSLGLPKNTSKNGEYWLDPYTGLVWQKLTGTRNYYDANDVRRTEVIDYAEEKGCRRSFGGDWTLPNKLLLKKAEISGLTRAVDYGELWMKGAAPRSQRKIKKEVLCYAKLVDVDPTGDYDGDGVQNAKDKCHALAVGQEVNDEGCEKGQKKDNWGEAFNPDVALEDYEIPAKFELDKLTGKVWVEVDKINYFDANDLPRSRRLSYEGEVQKGCKGLYGPNWSLATAGELEQAWNNQSANFTFRQEGSRYDWREKSRTYTIRYWIKGSQSRPQLLEIKAKKFDNESRFKGDEKLDKKMTSTYQVLHASMTKDEDRERFRASYRRMSYCVSTLKKAFATDDYDGDGVENIKDECNLFPRGIDVNAKGCEKGQQKDGWSTRGASVSKPSVSKPSPSRRSKPDRDRDGIADEFDKCPDTDSRYQVWNAKNGGGLHNYGCYKKTREGYLIRRN